MTAMGAYEYQQALHRSLVFAATFFFIAGVYLCTTRLFNSPPTIGVFQPLAPHAAPPASAHLDKAPGLALDDDMRLNKPVNPADLPMSYGQYARPGFEDLTLIGALPPEVIPTTKNGRRLIVIGDIHGMNDELAELLSKVKYSAATDHVVAAGDMVNKGPDSRGVIARLIALGASAVRGNHEDRVLLAHAEMSSLNGVGVELTGEDAIAHRGEAEHVAVARKLSAEQVAWLTKLPVILTADPLPIYIVHAGLVPGIKLEKQDPWAAMNMRTLRYPLEELRRAKQFGQFTPKKAAESSDDDAEVEADRKVAIPIEDHSGHKWSAAWDRSQKRLAHDRRRTVIYGHDAKRGFVEGKHTFGLDSACVNGGALSAMVIEASADNRHKAGWKHSLVQVVCRQGMRNRSRRRSPS
ncbi:ser/thr protein phosphatase family [Purpureocillium lavendulum]|uniref:Ser/thr protein phosphatase family n=1 Tax=Purpureocillium lavendulum TaxID=1247861 RepID=A0AB34G0Q0_9HYPO|nr:ser/thr protein phosphatase family [Purpureocillium lavendulum]